jgi:hypothetical protein
MPPDDLHGGLRSTGRLPLHLQVQAFCQCGWTGLKRPWDRDAGDAERAELAAHLADSDHRKIPIGVPTPDGYHQACGHFHQLNDACPVPPDSPRGLLQRIAGGSTIGRRDRALDRLTAIDELGRGSTTKRPRPLSVPALPAAPGSRWAKQSAPTLKRRYTGGAR